MVISEQIENKSKSYISASVVTVMMWKTGEEVKGAGKIDVPFFSSFYVLVSADISQQVLARGRFHKCAARQAK